MFEIQTWITEKEKKMGKIYIAGAHSRAQSVKAYLEYLYPETELISYLVDDMSDNEKVIEGVGVQLIKRGLHTECPVYIGTRGVNHHKITEELKEVGFTKIIPVTVELDIQLRNEYMQKFYKEQGKNFTVIDELYTENRKTTGNGTVYVACSIYDKPLMKEYKLADYETVLQVGSALTDERISENVLIDCSGDNISCKNKQFCELTGLYWLWKNATEDYIGLVHYRRHFLLPDNWKERMEENDIDVILPVPLYVAPSISENYMKRHMKSDWMYMMEYLKSYDLKEYNKAKRLFAGNIYSPCNMLIARRKVLDELCKWLFPILDAVVKHGGEKEDTYMNRYPGFISERLITYFFEERSNKYKVIYANKNFLT